MKTKKCKKCEKIVYKNSFCYEHFREYYNKKNKEYRLKNIKKFRERDKNNYYNLGKERICENCSSKFKRRNINKFCSKKCAGEYCKKNNLRKGKKSPSYKNGLYGNKNWWNKKNSKIANKHRVACKKYRESFLENNNYVYCENCGIVNSIRYETHHIVYASEAPRHKELHNPKNLIMLCIQCHNDFHGKKREIRKNIVIKRGLEELFNRQLYDRN